MNKAFRFGIGVVIGVAALTGAAFGVKSLKDKYFSKNNLTETDVENILPKAEEEN